MGNFLYLDGVDDQFNTPVITHNSVEIDLEVDYMAGASNYYFDNRATSTGAGSSLYSISSGLYDATTGATEVYINDVLVPNTDNSLGAQRRKFLPNKTRFKLRLVFPSTTSSIKIFAYVLNSYRGRGKVYDFKAFNNGSLVIHYDMSTGTLNDLSGNNNHGTLIGRTWMEKEIYVFDSFQRADNPNSLGKANTGQTWKTYGGVAGIQGNSAYFSTPVFYKPNYIEIDKADYSVGINYSVYNVWGQIYWRIQGDGNFYLLEDHAVYKYVNGQDTFIGRAGNVTPTSSNIQNVYVKIIVIGNTHQIYIDGSLAMTFTDDTFLYGNVGFGAGRNTTKFQNFLVESVDLPSIPPNPTILNVSKTKISPKPSMNQSIITVSFDQDVTEYVARLNGNSYDTGVLVHSGGATKAGISTDVIIDWDELTSEGENKINIYGRSTGGEWTLSSL